MAIKKYNVNWTLDHDGKQYQAGETVSLDEKRAEPLVNSGVIILPGKAAEGAGE
ncbi:hypothetical protein D3C72_2395000 [compost metagenome]